MSKLILVNASQLEKLLLHLGFKLKRRKGSHHFYRHENGRYTTIPHHGKKDLSRPLIRAILRQINISVDDYNSLIKKV